MASGVLKEVKINPSAKLITEYYRYRRKDGKLGAVRERYYWYTPLNDCQICGRRSTPKRVHCRNDCYREEWGTPMLCTGCWNRIRPQMEALDSMRATLKILKGVINVKARNNAKPATDTARGD